MLPVTIDISATGQEFFLSDGDMKALGQHILNSVADNFVRRWEQEIDNNLHSTRAEYKKGIFQENPDEDSVVIGLSPRYSKLSLMLEDGASSFDIKEGFANSAKKHLKKNGGWYLAVPFRFATAGAIGESMSFSNQLPKPIEKIVKVSASPLQMAQIPMQYQPIKQNQTSGYVHKFNIYEGLHREEIGSGTEKRGGYMNFRMISDKSDKDAWIHPGFEPLKLMEKASETIDIGNIVDKAIDEFLSNR